MSEIVSAVWPKKVGSKILITNSDVEALAVVHLSRAVGTGSLCVHEGTGCVGCAGRIRK